MLSLTVVRRRIVLSLKKGGEKDDVEPESNHKKKMVYELEKTGGEGNNTLLKELSHGFTIRVRGREKTRNTRAGRRR